MAIKVETICKAIRKNGKILTHRPTSKRIYADMDRYVVDFAPDFKSGGWAQYDTDQDAHYFGVWVNRSMRAILTYAEGDWTLEELPNDQEYFRTIEEMNAFYGEGFIAKAYGPDGATVLRQDRSEFLMRA